MSEPDVFKLQPGQSVMFDEKVTVCLTPDGNIEVKGRSDPLCVEFRYTEGCLGSSWRCFAVRTKGGVAVFQGSTVGRGVLSRQQVISASSRF